MNRTNHCASADNRPPSPSPLHGRALRARRCSKQLTKSKFSSLGRRGHPGRPEQIVGTRCKVHGKPPGCKTGWGARAAAGSPPTGARRGPLQLCSWNLEREFGGCTTELAACTPKISLAEQTAGMRSRRGLEAASRSVLPRCLLSCSRPSPGDEKLMNSFPFQPQKLCQLPFSPHLRLVRCFLWSRGRND